MKSPGSRSALVGRLLMGVSACVSLYLASIALGRTALPGCDAGSTCQDALQSRWAFVFGMPVSFVGFLLYSFTLLLSGAFVRRDRTVAGLEGGMAVSAIIAAAIWFSLLQIFALQMLCVWCSVTHGCGVAGAWLLCRSRRLHPAPAADRARVLRDTRSALSNDRVFRFTVTGAALAGTGMLALGALAGPLREEIAAIDEPDLFDAASSGDRGIALHGGKFHVDPDEFPAMGDPAAAPHAAIFLSDYTSARCRRNHAVLEAFIASASPACGIVVMPAALSGEAGDVHRTLLTVFHADREKSRSLSALLTSGQIPAEPDAVKRAALKLLGAEKWAEAVYVHAGKVERQLQLAAAILANGRSETAAEALPRLICGDRVLAGTEFDRAKLLAFFTGKKSTDNPASDGPSLMVIDTTVQLDGLKPGAPRDFKVRVRNDGAAPLKLGWLALDADCELTRLPEAPVEPGASAEIGLRITPPLNSAGLTRTLKIHSDAPGAPSTVTVRATTTGPAADTNAVKPPPLQTASGSPNSSPRSQP